MKLDGIASIRRLRFDIPARKLEVFHDGEIGPVAEAIAVLDLGSRILVTEEFTDTIPEAAMPERRLLWAVLLINFSFFLIEAVAGAITESMGLVADSLDMLADAFVCGMSLLAVGAAVERKKQVARLAGYLQLTLALVGFGEVLRRFIGEGSIPDPWTMIIVSILALLANAISYRLLTRARSDEAHVRASMIFTSNDMIINAGVIAAGVMVHLLGSRIPDLVIGGIVFVIVVRGARDILRLAR
jgi:Co/Zn/Cd efflux system component